MSIELLNEMKKLNKSLENNIEKDKEIERLNNIINEVREYIELGINFDSLGVARTKKELLKILDKVEEK